MEMAGFYDIMLRLIGVLALVAMNAFFVAAEFALVGARRTRLEQMAASGNSAAELSRRMQDDLDRYIAAAQLGMTRASVALAALRESTIAQLVDPPIESLMIWLLGNFAVPETLALTISHAVGI